jgi:hypothetical protein
MDPAAGLAAIPVCATKAIQPAIQAVVELMA